MLIRGAFMLKYLNEELIRLYAYMLICLHEGLICLYAYTRSLYAYMQV